MHTHEDSFECVREMFNLCREPSIRPFVSDDLFEMVSSPRKHEGMNEWGIRVDAFVGISRHWYLPNNLDGCLFGSGRPHEKPSCDVLILSGVAA